MNIRKNIDFSEMYEALDMLMTQQLPQVELYCEIGKAVCRRPEKGAAVMASEYLNEKYPDVKGFSPRSLRRMRDFYRTYENHPTLLSRAQKLGWIQNVVIIEAGLPIELREWYLKATRQFGWSKAELTARIAERAHLEIVLDIDEQVCDNSHNEEESASASFRRSVTYFTQQKLRRLCWGGPKRGGIPWHTMCLPIFVGKRIVFHAMLEKIQDSVNDTLYILGDVIDRAPVGIKFTQKIIDAPNMVMNLGNHEHMMIENYCPGETGVEIRRWNKNDRRQHWLCTYASRPGNSERL